TAFATTGNAKPGTSPRVLDCRSKWASSRANCTCPIGDCPADWRRLAVVPSCLPYTNVSVSVWYITCPGCGRFGAAFDDTGTTPPAATEYCRTSEIFAALTLVWFGPIAMSARICAFGGNDPRTVAPADAAYGPCTTSSRHSAADPEYSASYTDATTVSRRNCPAPPAGCTGRITSPSLAQM